MNGRHLGWLVGLVAALSGNAWAAQDLFVSGATSNSVLRFDGQTGAYLGNFVAPGAGGLSDPQGIDFGPDGNLYVASNGTNNILRFDGITGAFIDVFVAPAMSWPAEINFRNGFLYVSDFGGSRVARFDAVTGVFVDNAATGVQGADGQSWDANGDLYVSSWGDSSIKRFDGQTGQFLDNFVSPAGGALNGPLDNLFLPNGDFLVSSYNNSRIKRYSSDGVALGDAITIVRPQGLQIGPDGPLSAGSFTQGVINRSDINTLGLLGVFANANGATFTNNFVFAPPAPEPSACSAIVMTFLSALVWKRYRRTSARG
jgi:DNA-binding beta-propeller fold protein YncE